MTVTADPPSHPTGPPPTSTPDELSLRLQTARDQAAPLRRRVTDLETDLQRAVETSDYGRADQLQSELVPARQNAAIAEATVAALEQAETAILAARHDEQRKITEKRRHENAAARAEGIIAAEVDAMDEMNRHLAAARAGVDAVRESLQQALNFQGVAGGARRDLNDVRAELGEQVAPFVPMPSDVSSAIERDTVLRVIYYERH